MSTGEFGMELEESGVFVAKVEGDGFEVAEEEEVDADAEDAVDVGVLKVLRDDAD